MSFYQEPVCRASCMGSPVWQGEERRAFAGEKRRVADELPRPCELTRGKDGAKVLLRCPSARVADEPPPPALVRQAVEGSSYVLVQLIPRFELAPVAEQRIRHVPRHGSREGEPCNAIRICAPAIVSVARFLTVCAAMTHFPG